MAELHDKLKEIMARKRQEVAERAAHRPLSALEEAARMQPPARGFAHALHQRVAAGELAIIAEVKFATPRSPQKIHPGALHARDIASGYAEAGAACISCLTDHHFFQGHEEFLQEIRARVDLPVLRKDFLYDPWQVVESRAIGADAVLIIMGVMDSLNQAAELESAARELGMDVLVEVHDQRELEQAHELTSPLLGINNRDLKTLETRLDNTFRLAPLAEPGRLVVSESGIATPADLARIRDEAGVRAFLIGTAFMRESDPGLALQRFLAGVPR